MLWVNRQPFHDEDTMKSEMFVAQTLTGSTRFSSFNTIIWMGFTCRGFWYLNLQIVVTCLSVNQAFKYHF